MWQRITRILFSESSAGQVVVKNTFWLFLGEVLGRLIRFSIVVYAARILGAGEYGIFSYALTIAAFLTIFSDIGVSAVITRETSRKPELREQYISTAISLKLILIFLNCLLLLFVVPLVMNLEGVAQLLPLVLLIFAFDSMRELGFGINRGLEQMQREAVVKIIMNTAIAGLGFWALAVAPTAHALAVSYALGSGLGLIGTVIMLRQHLRASIFSVSAKNLGQMFFAAWPVGMLGLLGAIMINTDMFMLGWWVNSEQLGYYAAAQKIILLLYVAPTLFASAVFPALSRFAHDKSEAFLLFFEKSLRGILLVALPVAVCGIIVAPQLISLLFGAEYAPAALTLRLLLSTVILVFPSSLFSNALFAHDKQKSFLKLLALGAVSNALLNWLLIPRFGIEGAAWATIGSQLLSTFFVWVLMQRTVKFNWTQGFMRVLVATFLTAIFCAGILSLGAPILVSIFASIAVYGLLLIILKEPLTISGLKLLKRS